MLSAAPADQEVLRLRIFDRSDLVFDRTLRAGELREKGMRIELPADRPLARGSKPVFRIQSPADAPYLWVKNITLVHARTRTGAAPAPAPAPPPGDVP